MQVRFTLDALAHVAAIQHYVALRSVTAAVRIKERIFSETDRLSRFSHLGHPGIVLGTLEWTVNGLLPYVIVFERNVGAIVVLGIFHSKRERSID
jgi:plasmid stabilization system protein ParE